ncbi:MAG: helix-turn-helix domain-containing protein [Candidatus Cryptobacteroides sp.]
MRTLCRIILAVLIMSALTSGCRNRTESEGKDVLISKDSLGILAEKWENLIKDRNLDEAIDTIRTYYDRAVRAGDNNLLMESSFYLGSAFIDNPDSMIRYLDPILPEAQKQKNTKYLLTIYNAYAIYAMNTALNYTESIYWFNKALEITYKTGDKRRSCALMCNMTWNSYFRNDTTGRENAYRALEIATEIEDDYLLKYAQLSVSRMEYICGNFEKSLEYAQYVYYEGSTSAYPRVLIAKNLIALGKENEAIPYLDDIINVDEPPIKTLTMVEAFCIKARLLYEDGKFEEAISTYDRAYELSRELKDMNFTMTIFDGKAEVYEAMGRTDLMNEFREQSKAVSDTVFNIEKERAYGLLMMRYTNSINEIKIERLDKEIEKRNRRIWGLVLIVLVILLFASLYLYERNKRYKALADKYYQDYQNELVKIKMSRPSTNSDNERNAKLYEAMTKLMEEKEVWRDAELSRDTLAEMLGTNTSYLTSTMSSCTGKTFNDYINTFRINEAIRLLSREDDETPARIIAEQVGFNNLSTFYRVFQKVTGFPPSFYRKELQNKKKQN